jgi:hypothetical protein
MLFCVSWIVTPRALCGRGAIDVKPLQGFFAVLQAIKISIRVESNKLISLSFFFSTFASVK